MASGVGKADQPAEHDSGIGRIRERTIVIGDTLIAIDNIGSIQILEVKRNWNLARFGAVVVLGGIAVAVMPSNPYSSSGSPGPMIGLVVIGIGLAMIIGNALQPRRKGLGIGTGDGRVSYVISEDNGFLQRLLEFLTLKINTRNEGLTASFDITHNTFNTSGGAVAIGDSAVASGSGGHALGANGSVAVTNNAPPPAAPPPVAPAPAPLPAPPPAPPPIALSVPPPAKAAAPPPAPEAAIDPDDALFADDPTPAPPPKPRAEPPVQAPPRVAPAARTRPRDPLLDGPAVDARAEDDWLSAPGRISYRPANEGGARWLLPFVLLLLVGGGGFAGWYFYNQSQASTSISLIPTPQEAPRDLAIEPAAATPVQAEPVLPTEEPATPETTAPDPAPPEPVAVPAATPAATTPAPAITATTAEATSFTPPETIVARASGLRYRARPSAADDVPIIAETRNGGEVLLVNGRITLADGEWYRVAMPDGRPAWFKASLTVPRSRFAETFAVSATQPQSFAASAPRILEPAEGVQLGGGPQPVRLAWQGPASASIFIVEIEAYDTVARRWIEDPLHKRVTVESIEELAEAIPRAGAWRWRVRGVSPAGDQSQFSRWSAFGVRD